MTEVDKNIADGNLTQKEIIQLLLHNAQHMATREEVKDLNERIDNLFLFLSIIITIISTFFILGFIYKTIV